MRREFGGLRADTLPREPEADPSPSASRDDLDGAGEWSEGLSPFGVTEWQLPGEGDRGARCGEYYPEAVCDSCADVSFGSHCCGKRSCPDCWGMWAKEAAVRGTERIQQFRYTQPDDWHRQVAHGYVSPPEGEIRTKREYWDGCSEAAEIAESKGWRGFEVIPHPYRPTDDAKERYAREDPDYGIWVWLRNDVENIDEYRKWSPHYHIVGFPGADMEPAEDSDEWVYRFERSLEAFDGVRDSESHEDVYGLLRYLLSHTGYPAESTKQVVRWYGDLANSVFVEDASEEWQNQKPSEKVRSELREEIEEVAGHATDEEDGDGRGDQEDDEAEACECEGCDGEMIDVFDVAAYLRQKDPPPDVQEAMETARDWRLGRLQPPPGLKRPTTEEQARETFEAIL